MHIQQNTFGENSPYPEPFFIYTPEGRLFAIYHHPRNNSPIYGQILFVPPFNEEMNRCRSIMTLQAQALSALGFGVLHVDLFGTGDSEGEYKDARWHIWLQNLITAKAWLDKKPSGCQVVCGIRLGALLAAEFHATTKDSNIALVLWQPIVDGKLYFTQFLRIRIAAQIDQISSSKETTTTMRKQLADNNTIEVAGYEIHPELASSIDHAKLINHQLVNDSKVLWLENSITNTQELSVASNKALKHWPGENTSATTQIFEGSAFWQLHERVLNPYIIEHTTRWITAQKNNE